MTLESFRHEMFIWETKKDVSTVMGLREMSKGWNVFFVLLRRYETTYEEILDKVSCNS